MGIWRGKFVLGAVFLDILRCITSVMADKTKLWPKVRTDETCVCMLEYRMRKK